MTKEVTKNKYSAATKEMQQALREQLAQSEKKEIILFLHSFNNDFEDAALAITDIWHFTGHKAVPYFLYVASGGGQLFRLF